MAFKTTPPIAKSTAGTTNPAAPGIAVSTNQPLTSPAQAGDNQHSAKVMRAWQNDNKGDKNMNPTLSRRLALIVFVVMIVIGSGSGFALAYFSPGGSVAVPKENQKTAQEVESALQVGAVFGVPDAKTFKDETEGYLVKGGLQGEGSHTLLRPGGESQNVYLTSSVVDLDQFNEMEIRIWGETFKGQKAGWLMDVGRVEVLKTSADAPEWYQENQ